MDRVVQTIGCRIIPALAGNTVDVYLPFGCGGDHPRSRGEYTPDIIVCYRGAGSSPLSRGILANARKMHLRHRIIPALAGNTRGRYWPAGRRSDHPRSRGEYLVALIRL